MPKSITKESGALAVRPRPDRMIEEFLSEKLTITLNELRQRAWEIGADASLEAVYNEMKRLRRLREALAALVLGESSTVVKPSYLVSSSFLRKAFQTLTKTRDEHLVYATGPEDGRVLFALTRLVTFNLAARSAAHAAPEPRSQLKALMQLDENEERLLATFHSHTRTGVGATTPSSVDHSTQKGLEELGYPTIGAVFSRDGYVRFYAVNRGFRVVVSGAGVEKIEESLFRLTDTGRSSLLRRRSR